MVGYRSGISKHFLDEVKSDLNVEGTKGVNKTKGSMGVSLEKVQSNRTVWLPDCCCVWTESMRHEGGTTEKCKIKKGLVNHTRKFEFYPKGN